VAPDYAKAFNDGLAAAAHVVCPAPHIEEERACGEVAAAILALALPVNDPDPLA
jgi:hypothetical protein